MLHTETVSPATLGPRHRSIIKKSGLIILALIFSFPLFAQEFDLNSGWKAIRATDIHKTGEEISQTNFPLTGWMPAVVPGTVLTTLLANNLIPDPFYGMNNKQIPDIYNAGRDYYTYWFVKDFTAKEHGNGEKVWLYFRGVNNSYDVFVNGRKVNERREKSMFLRQRFDITSYLAKDGNNRLAVIVYPPHPVGNPNGGQGGDGMIAHNLTAQYTAGWDWIQPVPDRNTGIWDKVFIKKTKQAIVENTHVVTLVPGQRIPGSKQYPAIIKVSSEVENTGDAPVEGVVQYKLEGKKVSVNVNLAPHAKQLVSFPDLSLKNPMLWWPNGFGPQNRYDLNVQMLIHGRKVSDEENVSFGIRELKAVWNAHTKSREIRVNGQKIFIKAGNWILSDELLRFSKERYDAEIRLHRDMNLNLIRVWGGGITERPEFYDACDKYGLLVMQDFWVSGDCNGRWDDPMKLEDTNARRKYPDDHRLFITTLADQVMMLRNHPSLALWCGGNEIRPPADVLAALKDSILPKLDNTRFFLEYSNDDSMSYKSGDGPYTIQPTNYFWEPRSFPFNSEIGSVGIGDYESLERFIPKENMVLPAFDAVTKKWKVDSVWLYHKYISYDATIEAYGHTADVQDFANKAQLVNYNQYRAMMEGATSHMWDWYTGIIEWKTQNPWTAMVGQMYDVYLDPNACMYGMSEGSKPVHIMYDPIGKSIRVANNTCVPTGQLHLWATVYKMDGLDEDLIDNFVDAPAQTCKEYGNLHNTLDELSKEEGLFLSLRLYDVATGQLIDDNLYWLPDSSNNYPGSAKIHKSNITATARLVKDNLAEVTMSAPNGGPVAFFNRISLVNAATNKRILPVFYNNNYISVLPGQQKTVQIEFTPMEGVVPVVSVDGWNVDKKLLELK
jgi:mannosylglycoprotein endo-beta-mannosidase